MASQRNRYVTREEYRAGERTSPDKSDYLRGRVFAMGSDEPHHVLIVSNFVSELPSQPKQRPCAAFFDGFE